MEVTHGTNGKGHSVRPSFREYYTRNWGLTKFTGMWLARMWQLKKMVVAADGDECLVKRVSGKGTLVNPYISTLM
jgi:hypothetical protein